jgi:hypothetical protein
MLGTSRSTRVLMNCIVLLLVSAALAQSPALRNHADAQQNRNQANPELFSETSVGHSEPQNEAAGQIADLWRAYNAAVEHTSIWRNEDVRPLKPLTVDFDGSVEVVTATKHDITSPLFGDTWVTVVPELQTICRRFTADVTMQLRELLGLPPDHQIPKIVIMRVQSTEIFRPAPDPTPWTLCPCGNPSGAACKFDSTIQCGNSFPKDVAPSHVQWFGSTALSVRQVPGGFPWTHLGYTYNWRPGADRYGASEYVVRKGATVTIVANTSPEAYCRPNHK